ncbi:alpha/beta hydrolase [Aerococcaceae bacterium DSM 111176]|nr:alpha/beta hydrolase [Aerococcaceae bacterium DSM 111176]
MKSIGRFILNIITIFLVIILVVLGFHFYNVFMESPRGDGSVYKDELVDINGIPQYLLTRGENQDNPVVLVLHGGPATPTGFFSYYFQHDLEDEYTFVNWDQRGSGRTYYASPINQQEVATENLVADIDVIVDRLRSEYNENKIIILSHSWGSILGQLYTQANPEKVDRHIAVGQYINRQDEAVAADYASELALKSGDTETVAIINQAVDKLLDEPMSLENIQALRVQTSKYLPTGDNMNILQQIWMVLTSPDLGIDDVKYYYTLLTNSDEILEQHSDLINAMETFDATDNINFEVPYYFISGEEDWVTPYVLVEEYAAEISAPDVDYIEIPQSGHMPFLDKHYRVFNYELRELLGREVEEIADSDSEATDGSEYPDSIFTDMFRKSE